MNPWIAFVVIQASTAMPAVNATAPGPSKIVASMTEPKGGVELNVTADRESEWRKIVGVEATTTVLMPTVTTVGFQTKALCDAAVGALAKQSGVLSASCLQTEAEAVRSSLSFERNSAPATTVEIGHSGTTTVPGKCLKETCP